MKNNDEHWRLLPEYIRVALTHPHKGGSNEEFHRLTTAYEQAITNV